MASERPVPRALQGVLEGRHPILSLDALRRPLGEAGQPNVAHRVFLFVFDGALLASGAGVAAGLAEGAVSPSLRAS